MGYQTTHDLPAHTRADVRVLLQARLADRSDLRHPAKQAQWHGKGPSCMASHTLCGKTVEAAEASLDLLADRVVHLGGPAEGTVRVATMRTALKASPLTLARHETMVRRARPRWPSMARACVGRSSRPTQRPDRRCRHGSQRCATRGDVDFPSPHTRRSSHDHAHHHGRHAELCQGLGSRTIRHLQTRLGACPKKIQYTSR